MRALDGTTLRTEILTPGGAGPAPAVLIRTPREAAALGAEAHALAAAGFAVAVQELRGRDRSGGAFTPGADERADGTTAVAWVAGQPWCDGRVFLYGTGYEAYAAWCAAGHQAVAGVVSCQPWPPAGPPSRLDERLWWETEARGGPGRYDAILAERPELAALHHSAELPRHWPEPLPGWPPTPDNWQAAAERVSDAVRALAAPSLHLGSWYCRSAETTLRHAELAQAPDLLIGGWASGLTHRLRPACALDVPAEPAALSLTLDWLAATATGSPWRETRRCLVLGSNRWREQPRAGRYADVPLSTPAPRTTLRHDPADPHPSLPHSADVTPLAGRADVLRFDAGRPPHWEGAARLTLPVRTDAAVTLVATLIHARPDGVRTVLADATAPLSAGTGQEAVFTTTPISAELPAGHRLLVEVTAGRYPHYWAGPAPATVTLEPDRLPARLQLPLTGESGRLDEARLVDSRTGLLRSVRRVAPEPWWPPGLEVVTATVSDIADLLPWPADRVATGTAFFAPAQARRSAIGEAAERYAGNFVPGALRRASYRELAAAGETALDPASLTLYSEAQHAQPGFPFEPFTRELSVLWTAGRALDSGAPCWIPASLVHPDYPTPPREKEPLTHYPLLAGIAAGPSLAAAEAAALEETIERDATVIWWSNALPARPVDLTGGGLDRVLVADHARGPGWYRARGAAGGCAYRVIALPTVFPVPVIGVLIDDAEHDLAMLGVAARPWAGDAVLKALAEAVTLRRYQLGLLEPDGEIWQLAEDGVVNQSFFKPHRADRRYAASYRPDYRDVVDLACHGQLWLDPAMRAHLGPITDADDPIALASLPQVRGDRHRGYLAALAGQGLTPYAVELTTPDVRAAGIHVARVVTPGAYSNPPAAFPFLGGSRLFTDPVTLGLRAERPREEELCTVPLPHV